MVDWLIILAALLENLWLVPSTYTVAHSFV